MKKLQKSCANCKFLSAKPIRDKKVFGCYLAHWIKDVDKIVCRNWEGQK